MEALHGVDTHQDWYAWLMFFLKGIQTQAEVSLKVARDIDDLFKHYREQIQRETAHLNLLRVLEYSFMQPYITIALVSDHLDIPVQTVRRYIATLEERGILRVAVVLRHNERVFENHALLNILRGI